MFLRAVQHFRLDTESDYRAARELLTDTLARDRTFALALLTLASTYSVMAVTGTRRRTSPGRSPVRTVDRALELDPALPDAHAERAAEAFFYRWDWPRPDASGTQP